MNVRPPFKLICVGLLLVSAAGCVDDYADVLRDQSTVNNEIADALMLVRDEQSAMVILSRATSLKDKKKAIQDRKDSLNKRVQTDHKTLETSIPDDIFKEMDARAKKADTRSKAKAQELRALMPTLNKETQPIVEKILGIIG